MDGLEIFTRSEVNQREKDKCHIKSLICGVLKKKIDANELINKAEIESQRGNKLLATKGESGEG